MKSKRSVRRGVGSNLRNIQKSIISLISSAKTKILAFADARPLPAFFSLLGIFLVLIVVGNMLRKPKTDIQTTEQKPKFVSVFSIGQNPKIELTAKVEKSAVITISAQSPGIVQSVWVSPGLHISRGTQVVSLSTNYSGGSLPGAARQIAQTNYEFVKNNYDTQKEMIAKRRDIANTSDEMASELRSITEQSLSDTRALLSLNEGIMNSLDTSIAFLESTNVGGVNDAAISEANQAKAGVLSGLVSIRTALRNSEYQASGEKEPAQLSRMSKALTNQQLDLEERSLDLNRELSRLNLLVAQISESLLYPTSPFSGTVERVYVYPGQMVNPGEPLVAVTGESKTVRLVAQVSDALARQVSRIEPSVIRIGDTSLELTPLHVSSEATDGSMHTITYALPEAYAAQLANEEFVMISVPISGPKSSAAIPFVPLDAVYQTQNGAYVFVATASADKTFIAESKTIVLGEVVGSFVRVLSGIHEGDQIIVDRTVMSDDPVTFE